MSTLEELLTKSKTAASILDLNKVIIHSQDEFHHVLEKVPDYKMRPSTVRPEDIKINKKNFAFKMRKKQMRKLLKNNGERKPLYVYADPIPSEMKRVAFDQICSVPIDWKMLTPLRPKAKPEEQFFSRMVEMRKLQLKSEARDKKVYALKYAVKKVKNKSGIIETKLLTCAECCEEMCDGSYCKDFNYDLFARVGINNTEISNEAIDKSKIKGNKPLLKPKTLKGKAAHKPKTTKKKN